MPRRKVPKKCLCGCGQMTEGGDWLRGHNAMLLRAINDKAGGTLELKKIVEKQLHCRIRIKP